MLSRNLKTILICTAVLFVLTGCASKTMEEMQKTLPTVAPVTPERPKEDISAPNETVKSEKNLEGPAIPNGEIEKGPDMVTYIENEEAMEQILVGKWEYFGKGKHEGANAVACYAFNEDHTYTITQYIQDDAQTVIVYNGSWSLDRLFREDEALPDLLRLEMGECDIPEGYMVLPGGDYLFDHIAILDGRYVMGTIQANNGDTVLADMYDDVNPIFYKNDKIEEAAAPVTPRKNGEDICGFLYGVEHKDDTDLLYIAEGKQELSTVGNIIAYSFPTDEESEYPAEALENGFGIIFFDTNSDGDVINVSKRVNPVVDIYDFGVENPKCYISEYQTKLYDYSYNCEKYSLDAHFYKPIFIGKNPGVKWLNSLMNERCESYEKKIEERLEEEIERLDELTDMPTEYGPEEFYYSPYSIEQIYYDNDNNVSVAWYWRWFMGGVYNSGNMSVNVNIDTRKPITLEELLGISKEEVIERIADALSKEYELNPMVTVPILNEIEDITYWFDREKIYVSFESYELDMGSAIFMIELNRD